MGLWEDFKKIRDDFHPDGLDMANYLEAIESRYSITFTDAEWEEIRTVGALCNLICAKLDENPRRIPRDLVWMDLQQRTADYCGVRIEKVTESTRYVDDLEC